MIDELRYAIRRLRSDGWATLAAVPVLFDAYQIQLEHLILPSATFGFLVMVAITLTTAADNGIDLRLRTAGGRGVASDTGSLGGASLAQHFTALTTTEGTHQ